MDIEITDLTRNISTGLVTQAVYSFCKTSGDDTVYYRTSEIKFDGDADAEDFISYDNLTETIVSGWITAMFTQDQLDDIEAILNAKLSEIATPTTSTGIPWTE